MTLALTPQPTPCPPSSVIRFNHLFQNQGAAPQYQDPFKHQGRNRTKKNRVLVTNNAGEFKRVPDLKIEYRLLPVQLCQDKDLTPFTPPEAEAITNIQEAIEGCLDVLNERARVCSSNEKLLEVAVG